MLALYWAQESPTSLEGIQPIAVVTQTYGQSSVIRVPQLSKITNEAFYVYSTTIDTDGQLIMVTPALFLKRHQDTYSVLTYHNLPVGNYNVVVNVNYEVNPIKSSSQRFTLATLSVIGVPDGSDSSTAKTICFRDPDNKLGFSGSNTESDVDSIRHN
jgi:hypothetical protein